VQKKREFIVDNSAGYLGKESRAEIEAFKKEFCENPNAAMQKVFDTTLKLQNQICAARLFGNERHS